MPRPELPVPPDVAAPSRVRARGLARASAGELSPPARKRLLGAASCRRHHLHHHRRWKRRSQNRTRFISFPLYVWPPIATLVFICALLQKKVIHSALTAAGAALFSAPNARFFPGPSPPPRRADRPHSMVWIKIANETVMDLPRMP